VSARYGGKPKYYLVHIADHPDADWLINDLLATVESRLYIVSAQRDHPGALAGFFEEDNKQRLLGLRRDLGAAALKLLAERPTRSASYQEICLELRPRFFGRLKEGDYSKAIKELPHGEEVGAPAKRSTSETTAA
jgi:hypothetical protein